MFGAAFWVEGVGVDEASGVSPVFRFFRLGLVAGGSLGPRDVPSGTVFVGRLSASWRG